MGFNSSAGGWGGRTLPDGLRTTHMGLWLVSGLRQPRTHKGRPFIPASKGLSVWQGEQHGSKQHCCPLVLRWETKLCRSTRVLTQENQPAILVLGPLSS